METSMKKPTHRERLDERMAAQTLDRSPEWLNTETEDGKYKILAQLLSTELEKIKLKHRR